MNLTTYPQYADCSVPEENLNGYEEMGDVVIGTSTSDCVGGMPQQPCLSSEVPAAAVLLYEVVAAVPLVNRQQEVGDMDHNVDEEVTSMLDVHEKDKRSVSFVAIKEDDVHNEVIVTTSTTAAAPPTTTSNTAAAPTIMERQEEASMMIVPLSYHSSLQIQDNDVVESPFGDNDGANTTHETLVSSTNSDMLRKRSPDENVILKRFCIGNEDFTSSKQIFNALLSGCDTGYNQYQYFKEHESIEDKIVSGNEPVDKKPKLSHSVEISVARLSTDIDTNIVPAEIEGIPRL
jgi:hypothetical protein